MKVMTFGEARTRFLERKSRKRTIKTDQSYLGMFATFFGADTPLTEITASRISAWREQRLAAICPQTKAPYSAAAVNRPLSTLSALLRLARDEWEVLALDAKDSPRAGAPGAAAMARARRGGPAPRGLRGESESPAGSDRHRGS
jgi:hypothetical protein